jgi:hypothetical protein
VLLTALRAWTQLIFTHLGISSQIRYDAPLLDRDVRRAVQRKWDMNACVQRASEGLAWDISAGRPLRIIAICNMSLVATLYRTRIETKRLLKHQFKELPQIHSSRFHILGLIGDSAADRLNTS